MSILDRSALEESPLADLHAIASELSIDGYRRLRKPELIDAILGRQGRGEGEAEPDAARQEPDAEAEPEAAREEPEAEAEPVAPPADLAEEPTSAEPEELTEAVAEELGARAGDRAGIRRRRGRRGGRGRAGGPDDREELEARERREEPEARERREEPEAREERGKREDREDTEPRAKREAHEEAPEPEHAGETQPLERPAEEVVEGVVELLANGSGFMRVHPPDPSDDDVYISAAQVKRCDLVSGDRISGPRRAPRRSERFASLVRVDTINDRPAAEVADSSRFDELPVAFPSERLRLGSEDPTITAIESLAPIGRGSRVVIAGPAQAGKTEALRRIAAELAGQDEVQLLLALVGVRPEEIPEWPGEPVAAVALGASADVQALALERAIDQGRRLAARGSHAVVLVDTLEGLPAPAARRALAAARSIRDGGSVTVIATAAAPLGGETTVVALDPALARIGRFPALDPAGSWTMRPELLVGEAGAEAILQARGEASAG